VQDTRKGGFLENLGGSLFYKTFNLLSHVPIPADALMARLMTRAFVNAVIAHEERELFLDGVMSLAGFRQTSVFALKGHKGTTTYTPLKRISLAINAVTSFSDRPLIGIFVLGIIIAFLAFLGMIYIISRVLVFGTDYLAGWPSLIVSIWFFAGLILMSIGVVGLYMARIFLEVKKRPRIVSAVISNYDQASEPTRRGH
jgi:putative glycosyltransferase